MFAFVRLLLADSHAVTIVEYTLIVAMIGVAAISGLTLAGQSVLNMLGPAASALN